MLVLNNKKGKQMMVTSTNKKSRVCAAVLTALLAQQAVAQESNEQSAETNKKNGLEVIEVTAQKRVQSLQDVGISVTALNADAIQRYGIDDISRIELITPGVAFGFIGSDAKIAIRGANSNNTFGDNASIAGFFADGVYRPRASQQSQAYFDVARIEVLKGPQGTLYGRNTFAGAVNLTTNKATLGDFDMGVKLGFERFNRRSTETFINQPITDDLAVRVAVQTIRSDGYIKNIGPAGDLGQEDSFNYRLSSYWQPSATFDATVRFTSIKQKGTTPGSFAAEGLPAPVNQDGVTDVRGEILDFGNPGRGTAGTNSSFDRPNEVSYDVENKRDLQEDNLTIELNWDLDSVTVKSVSSYTDFSSALNFDGDFSPTPGTNAFWDEAVESVTQELQISSNNDSNLFWTTGAYYSKDQISFGYSQFSTVTNAPFGTVIDSQGREFTLFDGTESIDPFGAGSFSDYTDFQEIDVTTLGLFFQGEYSVSDALTLIAGIRYNEEEKDTTTSFATSKASDGSFLPGVTKFGLNGRPIDLFNYTVSAGSTGSETFDIVTWKIGFNYDLNDDSMIYGSGSTGFLSGGLNSNGSSFDQQESEAWEVGMKNRLLDNSLQLNFAFYMNEFSDLVTQRLIFPEGDSSTAVTVSENAGASDVLGFEAEVNWIPTENWFINAGLSLMDAEYDTFGVSNPFQLNGGLRSGDVNNGLLVLDGTIPPWSPDMTLSLGAGHEFNLGDNGTITPYLQFYYSAEYNTDDVAIYASQLQDSYTKTDLRVTWLSLDETLSVELFVENIEDEEVLARTNIGGNNLVQGSYLHPRNYGVKLRYHF
jgi:outer membrane receptor protein involved in Fe transport